MGFDRMSLRVKMRKKEKSERKWKMGLCFCRMKKASMEIKSRRVKSLRNSMNAEWRCLHSCRPSLLSLARSSMTEGDRVEGETQVQREVCSDRGGLLVQCMNRVHIEEGSTFPCHFNKYSFK